jgi:apolipoprotein N-acyltransferase
MHVYLAGGIGGLLLGIGTVFFPLWPVSLFSFAFLLYVLYAKNSERERLLAGAVFGGVAYACSFYGIYFETMPLDWLGLPNPTAFSVLTSIWLFTILIFAGSFALLLKALLPLLCRRWFDGVLLASIYVFIDTVGTFLYSIVFYGQNARIGPHFGMGSPAYQLADSLFFIQAATLGGIYALLFIQALIGCLFYFLLRSQKTRTHQLMFGGTFLCVVLFLCYAPYPFTTSSDDPTISVAAVSIYNTKHESDAFRNTLKQTLKALPADIDIIALPEDSRLVQYLEPAEATALHETFADAYILDSGTVASAKGFVPEIAYYSTARQETARSSKEFLMVFGEYMPYLYSVIGTIIGQGEVVRAINDNHGYATSPPHLFSFQGIPLSVKLCSDAMSPVLYQNDVASGAAILFNLSSHGWFHRSELLYELALRVGKIRAVESHRWYIRSAYETPAFIVDAYGRVVAESAWLETGTITVDVPVLTNVTPYSTQGFKILLIPLGILLYCALGRYRARIARSS